MKVILHHRHPMLWAMMPLAPPYLTIGSIPPTGFWTIRQGSRDQGNASKANPSLLLWVEGGVGAGVVGLSEVVPGVVTPGWVGV